VISTLSTAKLIGGLVGLLVLIGLVAMVNGWRVERNHLRDWQAGVVQATREASGNPKLGKDHVSAQIGQLGKSIANLKAAIANQNAAVNALAAESDRQRAAAVEAAQRAEKASRGAQATSDSLAASSRSGERLTKPCLPSPALKDAWK
jgi:methyl-accepting chemotaxis protein